MEARFSVKAVFYVRFTVKTGCFQSRLFLFNLSRSNTRTGDRPEQQIFTISVISWVVGLTWTFAGVNVRKLI
jgi:hypothetical protein